MYKEVRQSLRIVLSTHSLTISLSLSHTHTHTHTHKTRKKITLSPEFIQNLYFCTRIVKEMRTMIRGLSSIKITVPCIGDIGSCKIILHAHFFIVRNEKRSLF